MKLDVREAASIEGQHSLGKIDSGTGYWLFLSKFTQQRSISTPNVQHRIRAYRLDHIANHPSAMKWRRRVVYHAAPATPTLVVVNLLHDFRPQPLQLFELR